MPKLASNDKPPNRGKTLQWAGEYLGVSRGTVEKLVHEGILPAYVAWKSDGGQEYLRVTESALERYRDSNRYTPPEQPKRTTVEQRVAAFTNKRKRTATNDKKRVPRGTNH